MASEGLTSVDTEPQTKTFFHFENGEYTLLKHHSVGQFPGASHFLRENGILAKTFGTYVTSISSGVLRKVILPRNDNSTRLL